MVAETTEEVYCDLCGMVVNDELRDHWPGGMWPGEWNRHSEELEPMDLCMGHLIRFREWYAKYNRQ